MVNPMGPISSGTPPLVGRHEEVRGHDDVFGERAIADVVALDEAVDLVAFPEPRHAVAGGVHRPREVTAEDRGKPVLLDCAEEAGPDHVVHGIH